jgi:hypothetical protein
VAVVAILDAEMAVDVEVWAAGLMHLGVDMMEGLVASPLVVSAGL